jgi:predicted metal-dependent phosphotriesterase family hydrolase
MTLHSVTGPVSAEQIHQVLPHEHLVIDYGMMDGRPTLVDEGLQQRCVEVLRRLRRLGVGTVVDCTPPGYGRDLHLLQGLSRSSGVHIVASTGSFCEQWHHQPMEVADASVSQLVDRFADELQPSGRCGVIKAATSHGQITFNEEKLLLGAAGAHRRTGARIVSHTTDGLGLEQLALYAEEGVDSSSVLVSHVCSGTEPFDYAVEIGRRGAFVGLDRLGHDAHDIDHWVRLVQHLKSEGQLGQVLLSHDSVQRFTGPEEISSHTFSDPTYLHGTFLPALGKAGISEEEQALMTRTNPRRWLLGRR